MEFRKVPLEVLRNSISMAGLGRIYKHAHGVDQDQVDAKIEREFPPCTCGEKMDHATDAMNYNEFRCDAQMRGDYRCVELMGRKYGPAPTINNCVEGLASVPSHVEVETVNNGVFNIPRENITFHLDKKKNEFKLIHPNDKYDLISESEYNRLKELLT